MPTYKFEAMDTTGSEVKDSIDALNEEEAQQKIKQMGYFVTKLTAMGAGGKGKGKEKAQTLKRKIVGAMVYPAVVIFVAISILTFIMVAIIPKFKKIFDDFNMRLPWATEVLIQTSMWFADYWWVLPLFPMGLFILIKLVRMSRSGAYAVDRMKLWIP